MSGTLVSGLLTALQKIQDSINNVLATLRKQGVNTVGQEVTIAAIQLQLQNAITAINTASTLVNTLAVVQTPNISSVSPNNGVIGASITINGTNFGAVKGTSTVKFNGVLGVPTSWSATSIVVPVPATATTGNVVVNVSGLNSNGVSFTVTVAPHITTLSPNTGDVATSVTITGTAFGASQGASTVKFNGTLATVTTWSDTSIVVPVPNGAVTGTVIIRVGGLDSNAVTFTVTFGSNVNNDRTIRAFPTLPTLGAAGTFIFDPTFGTKIWRVTDLNTNFGGAVHMPSSMDMSWNINSTRFLLSGAGGNCLFFDFDGTTITYRPDITIQNQAEPCFSRVDPDIVYSNAYNPVTGSYRMIKKWNIANGTNVNFIDLDTLYAAQGMSPGGFMGPLVAVDNDVMVMLFGGGNQDSHFLIHHSVLGLIDSRTLVSQSNAGPVTGFTMHGFGSDRVGSLFLAPSSASLSANPGMAQTQKYDSITHTLTPLTVAGGGHYNLSYGIMVNEDSSGAFDSAQWCIRQMTALDSPTNLISPLLTPQLTTLSDHTSWRNSQSASQQPILSSVFRYDIPLFGAVAQRAWDNEILTIATNGSGEVRRHCHHRSIYDPNDFYSQAEANIDPSGQYALFTSNWGQNVGAGRTDVFMVKLSL